ELPCPSPLRLRPRLRSLTAPGRTCAFAGALKITVPSEARDLVSPGKTRILELSFRPEGGALHNSRRLVICVQVALKSRSLTSFGMTFRQPRAVGARAVTSLQRQRRLVNDHAGAHRRADRNLLQVLALGRGRLGLHQVGQQRGQVFLQALGLEVGLADRAVD